MPQAQSRASNRAVGGVVDWKTQEMGAMSWMKEFRDFAMRGNVVDMAVGVIIGGAFGKIITSLVDHVMMPPIGYLTGGVDFKDNVLTLVPKSEVSPGVTLQWGLFANTVIQFTIVAFCLFLVIKAMNAAKSAFDQKAAAASPPEPPADVKLLTEIRDLMKARG
jgi:large conductance mechanosensitive channel